MSDRAIMIDFISRYLKDGNERLILAQGPTRKDDIIADVMVCGDELIIESNCPKEESEWITVREVYSQLRWREMPSWEKKEWQRLAFRPEPITSELDTISDLLIDRIVSKLQNKRQPTDREETKLARYRFQRVGSIWHIHFPVGNDVRTTSCEDNKALRQIACLLSNQDRWISSNTLAGHDDLKTLGLIAADSNRRSERRFGSLTIHELQSAFGDKQARVQTSKMQGDIKALEKAENDLEEFIKEYGETPEDFRRVLNQREENKCLAKSFHESVRKSRQRLLKSLRSPMHNMAECADYLEMTIQSEGYGFAYRPPSIAPDWIL